MALVQLALTACLRKLFSYGNPGVDSKYISSNIEGLPTWFEVRVNDRGYLGRREGVDIMVAMNAETFEEDVNSLLPEDIWYMTTPRSCLNLCSDRISTLSGCRYRLCFCLSFRSKSNVTFLKILLIWECWPGLINIEFEIITGMVSTQYKGKDDLIEPNIRALEIGRNYALKYLDAPIRFQVERSDKVSDKIFVEGNEAAGLGAVYGGASVLCVVSHHSFDFSC